MPKSAKWIALLYSGSDRNFVVGGEEGGGGGGGVMTALLGSLLLRKRENSKSSNITYKLYRINPLFMFVFCTRHLVVTGMRFF